MPTVLFKEDKWILVSFAITLIANILRWPRIVRSYTLWGNTVLVAELIGYFVIVLAMCYIIEFFKTLSLKP